MKYKTELLDILRLLRDKALSRRGYSWTGKLLSSALLTLTHTYPLENRFVNPDEWGSEGMLVLDVPLAVLIEVGRVQAKPSPALGKAILS